MRVHLVYEKSPAGLELLEGLKKDLDQVSCTELNIGQTKYLGINIGTEKEHHYRIMNHPEAIRKTLDHENISGILSINKIKFDIGENVKIVKIYEVLLFDFKVITLRQKVPAGSGYKVRYLRENQKTKVVELAKRAIHLSGLDIGRVSIVLTGKNKLRVTGITPSPGLGSKEMEAVTKRIDLLRNYQKKEIKMGADPEFMIINKKSGKMVSASNYFPRDGMVGCDAIRLPNRQQRPVAELRPVPDRSPYKLVGNIKSALIRANSMAPYTGVRWVAGSQPIPGYAIGGHIHFSNIQINAAVLRALDNYLAIPLFMIEKSSTASSRRKKYGFLGDFREKDYGGFEYRTPGSWLMSQKITTAVICLAKIVVSSYLELRKNYLNDSAAQIAFYSGDTEYFAAIFNRIWYELEMTDMFTRYEKDLAIIPEMVREGIKWDEKMDLRIGWNLNSKSKKKSKKSAQKRSSNNRSPEYDLAISQESLLGERLTGVSGRQSPENIRNQREQRENGTERRPRSSNDTNRGLNDNPRGRVVAPDSIRRSINLA